MPWVAICERLRVNMGRNLNQTYANVVVSTRQLTENASAFVTNNPTHPWADPGFNEFIIDLTDQEASDIRDGTNPLTHDGFSNVPRWQQQIAGSGSTKAFGNFADLDDTGSAFTLDAEIPDSRWIVRIYDDDPVVNPGTATHVALEDFDEDTVTPTITRHLRLFNPDDTPNSTNAQNQRTEIGGKLMDFDFTSGVAQFQVRVSMAGKGLFPSDEMYRVIGPAGEKEYCWNVFGKVIEVEES